MAYIDVTNEADFVRHKEQYDTVVMIILLEHVPDEAAADLPMFMTHFYRMEKRLFLSRNTPSYMARWTLYSVTVNGTQRQDWFKH